MLKKFCLNLMVAAFAVGFSAAQSRSKDPERPSIKVVITDNTKPAAEKKDKERGPVKVVISDDTKTAAEPKGPSATPSPMVILRPRTADEPAVSSRTLSFRQIKSKLAEAKRQMQSRPLPTALTESDEEGSELVRIAFHDWTTNELDYIVMPKSAFLSTKEDKEVTSQNGRRLITRTIRGNGVNTPIILLDEDGVAHLPLMVQYPVIRGGKYIETAYYMSTHPGLVTPEVVSAGKLYIHNIIEIARERLEKHGIKIQPKIADIAERLAAVEHVDHTRFRNEPHINIYNDIYTLFALNEGQTYRYAVSSAGAGGLVQMIPSTYRMIRGLYPGVPLTADFVDGMRDHVNAAQAMLLYMHFTWNDLASRPEVADALLTGIATQEQLMAAGYNSNPARLPGYIARGGAGWTELIPRETKIYLQIYSSIEANVPVKPRLQ